MFSALPERSRLLNFFSNSFIGIECIHCTIHPFKVHSALVSGVFRVVPPSPLSSIERFYHPGHPSVSSPSDAINRPFQQGSGLAGGFTRAGSAQPQLGSAALLSAASLSIQGPLRVVPGGVLSGGDSPPGGRRGRLLPPGRGQCESGTACDHLLSPPTCG